MSKIKVLSSWETHYPAFKWCNDYGKDWYFPALNELKSVYNAKTNIDSTLSANDYTTLGTELYWSSTDESFNSAYGVYFSTGKSTFTNKDEEGRKYKVCAILAF